MLIELYYPLEVIAELGGGIITHTRLGLVMLGVRGPIRVICGVVGNLRSKSVAEAARDEVEHTKRIPSTADNARAQG